MTDNNNNNPIMPDGYKGYTVPTSPYKKYCRCGHNLIQHTIEFKINRGTMPLGMKAQESDTDVSHNACNICELCNSFIDNASLSEDSKSKQRRKSSAETNDKVAGGLMFGSLFGGIIIAAIGVIFLHWGALIFGMILFFIPIFIAFAIGGNSSSRNHDDNSGFWMYWWGSHQAKKNMRRGHRYSK